MPIKQVLALSGSIAEHSWWLKPLYIEKKDRIICRGTYPRRWGINYTLICQAQRKKEMISSPNLIFSSAAKLQTIFFSNHIIINE